MFLKLYVNGEIILSNFYYDYINEELYFNQMVIIIIVATEYNIKYLINPINLLSIINIFYW